MRKSICSRSILQIAAVLLATVGTATAQVCIRVEETRDTLSIEDRVAAVLQLARQFELAGRHVVPDCPTPYMIRHSRLGDVITVTLSGSEGQREGTAQGLSDLPALYSQLVRSLATGLPTVDRSNVTASQASTSRVPTDSYFYTRLGYGGVFSDRTYGKPAIGFGYRAELDSFAIDASFLNVALHSNNSYSAASSATAGSLLGLEGMYFLHSKANATPYFGGGISYGYASMGSSDAYSSSRGSGLQGELTAGYVFARTTTMRVFVQADACLPFYRSTSQTYSMSKIVQTSQSYVPSLVISIGFGWQRYHR